jgi:methylamine---glutamate N-methyltransferase subunit C
MRPHPIARWSDVPDREPVGALVGNVDLVIVRYDDEHSVLYGRCDHRGALLADGSVRGDDLVCGVHGWDYGFRTGISAYDNDERLAKFASWLDDGQVMVDADEIAEWERDNPQPYDRSAYQGAYQDVHGTPDEPHVAAIRELAANGLTQLGHHGTMVAMGVPRDRLPAWDDIQIVTAQLARRPLLDDAVATDVTIGASADAPLRLEIPLFVSDMSLRRPVGGGEGRTGARRRARRHGHLFGGGRDARRGARGELPLLLRAGVGEVRLVDRQGARRAGVPLQVRPGSQDRHRRPPTRNKVVGRIAEVRELDEGTDAVSPATFTDLRTVGDFRELAAEVREVSGGIPIGAKLSAQHIEADLDAALEIGVDYVILDGRGGGTGAAPAMFRDHISVPTIPALARARRHLDACESDITLVITGGLRTHVDFVKALALGADAVAISNAALQAIGCLGMRACNTDNCPVGIATQKPGLRQRLVVEDAARRLTSFLESTVELMTVLARACGHAHLSELCLDDLTTFDREMHHLAGVPYGGLHA